MSGIKHISSGITSQNKWTRQSKIIAGGAAGVALLPALLTQYWTKHELTPLSRLVLLLFLVALTYFYTAFILNQLRQQRSLAALPQITYPFKLLYLSYGAHLIILVALKCWYFGYLLWPTSPLLKYFGSIPFCSLFVLALSFVAGGGGALVRQENTAEGILYRDQLSPSRWARQDIFYSFNGSYAEGIILSGEIIPYQEIKQIDEGKKGLLLRCQTQAEPSQAYAVLLYTPRSRRFASALLAEQKVCAP